MATRRIMKLDGSAAFAAALLIGIQTILMSVSLGQHAALSPIASLCSALSERADPGDTPAKSPRLPDCCSFGCALSSGSPLPDAGPLPVLQEIAASVAYLFPDSAIMPEARRSSFRSRGPPSLV
jgi:hypothetical protein